MFNILKKQIINSEEKAEPIELPKPNNGEVVTFNDHEEKEPIELPKPNDGEKITKGG